MRSSPYEQSNIYVTIEESSSPTHYFVVINIEHGPLIAVRQRIPNKKNFFHLWKLHTLYAICDPYKDISSLSTEEHTENMYNIAVWLLDMCTLHDYRDSYIV